MLLLVPPPGRGDHRPARLVRPAPGRPGPDAAGRPPPRPDPGGGAEIRPARRRADPLYPAAPAVPWGPAGTAPAPVLPVLAGNCAERRRPGATPGGSAAGLFPECVGGTRGTRGQVPG